MDVAIARVDDAARIRTIEESNCRIIRPAAFGEEISPALSGDAATEVAAGMDRTVKLIKISSALLLIALTLVACGKPRVTAADTKRAKHVEVWVTLPDQSALLSQQPSLKFSEPSPSASAIIVDPSHRFQQMVGFGASITDASASLIQSKLDNEQRSALIAELFGGSPGLGLSFTRIAIGASDFSASHYSFNDMPPGKTDPELDQFTIAPAKKALLPTLRAALEANPDLTIMASPWSAPGWMKTSGTLITGTLRDDAFAPFAAYFRRTIEEFAAEGVPVHYISIQNEPDFEPSNYPGMRLSPDQRARFVGAFLGPELQKAGLQTKILEWDHNWDQPGQPLAVLDDETAASYISGVAWHCYAGNVAAQSVVRSAHPDKDVFFTECSGGGWSKPWPDAWIWTMQNIVIGASRHWGRGALMWNLALDENSGPHLGGCGNCRGVVTIDSRTGEITRNPEYYALGHVSRFVEKDAWRISSESSRAELESVAFLNEGGTRVLVVLNAGEALEEFAVNAGDRSFSYALPPGGAATFRWR